MFQQSKHSANGFVLTNILRAFITCNCSLHLSYYYTSLHGVGWWQQSIYLPSPSLQLGQEQATLRSLLPGCTSWSEACWPCCKCTCVSWSGLTAPIVALAIPPTATVTGAMVACWTFTPSCPCCWPKNERGKRVLQCFIFLKKGLKRFPYGHLKTMIFILTDNLCKVQKQKC